MDDLFRRAKLLERLSPRERQVLRLTCAGMSNQEIAIEIDRVVRTVIYHKVNIYKKFNVGELQDGPRALEISRYCGLLESLEAEGPVEEDDVVPPALPTVVNREMAAVVNDDRDLARRRQAQEAQKRLPVPYQQAPMQTTHAPLPQPPRIPQRRGTLAMVVGLGAVILVLAAAVVVLLLRGPQRETVAQQTVATSPVGTERATPVAATVLAPPVTAAPAPTPQPVSGPTFAVPSQIVGCHATPDVGANAVAQVPRGAVQSTDLFIRLPDGSVWYRDQDKSCWVRTQPGPIQLFKTLAEARRGAANLAPPIYAADWSTGLNGWASREGWKVLDGVLINDGTGTGSAEYSPFRPDEMGLSDYAVEVEIQFLRVEVRGNDRNSFGFLMRDTIRFDMYSIVQGPTARLFAGETQLASVPFKPGNEWHTYRGEVRSNQFTYLIDGVVVAEGTDNRFLNPGRIALLCGSTMQIAVRSFRVLRLP